MYLTVLERQALTDAAAEGFDEIEATLQQLRIVNAAAFHTLSTLATRVFFDQPVRNEPCLAYVRAHQPKGD
ncbi:hypothetical protein [Ralstonia pseudosolanacearum]|uniref:hypothetical protein n=1 Tax=Ralstonia pseudosolanacearum TaxID=1310165 RepID=UPI00405488EC